MRYRIVAGLLAAAVSSMAVGQTTSGKTARTVDDYLCTFAGKCGGTGEATPTMAAPATKGFRLATPGGVPQGAARPAERPATMAAGHAAATARHSTMAGRHSGGAPAMAVATRPVSAGAHANLMLTFTKGSDRMTRTAQRNAMAFATALARPELADKRFLIEGHTDTSGTPAGNMALSRQRAEAVVDFLVAHGVARGRLSAEGVGSSKPMPGTAAASPSNRRVEAVLQS